MTILLAVLVAKNVIYTRENQHPLMIAPAIINIQIAMGSL